MVDWTLPLIGPAPGPPDGFETIARAVTATGDLMCLHVAAPASTARPRTISPAGASFPLARPDRPLSFALSRSDGAGSGLEIALGDHRLAFPRFDMFPDGRVLLAGSRADFRSRDDFDRNGIVVDGGACRHILLGDGIEHLQIDGAGRIWVGYFDEGIFGNSGWSNPVGAPGLVVFNDLGSVLWRNGGIDMADCYALNVAADAAWVCAYADFQLCRLDADFGLSLRDPGLSGCRGVAVHGDRALFSGQYDEPAHRFHLIEPGPATARPRALVVGLEGGAGCGGGDILMRGGHVHVVSGGQWYRGHLSDLPPIRP